ncbi:MAG: TonB family protein [Puniceicoccaceae bacterium]
MAMERQTRQSVTISVLIHGGFVALALLFLLLERWLEEPEPIVFELVAGAPAPVTQERPAEPIEESPLEPLEVPDTEPIKPLPDVPELPEPEPDPPPEPEPEPVKTISAEEFFRNRDRPDRVQRVQQPRTRPVTAPEIETNVRDRLSQLPEIQIQGAEIGQFESNDALLRYLAALRQQIQAAFEPTGSNLQAEAYFTVTAQGRITNARIHKSSGDAAFDRSAIRTLQVARTPGPPPGGRDYTFSLVFRSE